MSPRRSTRVDVTVDEDRGVFMISVAAELADMHPQTLRIYESKGLINPKRSPKNTRLYSQRDVERLRRIQQMTNEEGLNLAGVETVLRLEREVAALRAELKKTRARSRELERRLVVEMARDDSRRHAEIVPYGVYETSIPGPGRAVRISVERPHGGRGKESL